MMKKLLSLTMVFCLIIMMLAGCGSSAPTETEAPAAPTEEPVTETEAPKSTDPLDMITDGYYVYGFTAEGHGDYVYYFHFYEEAPVLGSVFYAGFSNNKVTFTGTYTVEETPCEYAVNPDRNAAVSEEDDMLYGTAPYTVTFYDWAGNVLDSCGFDGDKLYNDLESIAGSGSGPMLYHHDTDGEASKYASSYAGEVGVAYLDFVVDGDGASTLTLNHNMTYVDLVGMMVEGTWSMEQNAEGGYSYNLTPNDPTDTGAVLAVAADTASAVYTPNGGEAVNMINSATTGPELVYLFEGTYFVESYNTDAALALKLYDDGTCVLTGTVYGSEGELDKGTYAVDGYLINFTLDAAGEITSVLDYETHEMSVPYAATGLRIGDVEASLVMNKDAVAAAEILFSFTGGFTTFDCYDDNTFVFKFESGGVEETGTWAFESYTFSITKSDGTVITATMDEAYSLVFEYVAVINEQLKDSFTCTRDVWGPALTQ